MYVPGPQEAEHCDQEPQAAQPGHAPAAALQLSSSAAAPGQSSPATPPLQERCLRVTPWHGSGEVISDLYTDTMIVT